MTFSRLVLSLSDKNGERRVLELLKLDTGIIVIILFIINYCLKK